MKRLLPAVPPAIVRGAPRLVVSLLLLLFLLDPAAPGEAQVPPDAEWRTLHTENFRVTYHVGLEHLAERAAERAERAWAALADAFIQPPRGRVDLVLTDQADISNGFANVIPSNRIVVFARPPVDAPGLAWYDDWLELVVTHELAHVFHLDRSGVLGRALRALFGRPPASWPFFPGRSVPDWTIEGIATFYESALSDAGRARGTYHEMILRTAILEGTFERIDQAGGSTPVWPGGSRSYAYGSLFIAHLLERYGPERMRAFVEAVAGQWVPYRLDAAARSAFGVDFRTAWRAWEAELEEESRALAAELAERRPLTQGELLAREARAPVPSAIAPDGERVAFVRLDGTSDPQIRVARPDGSGGRRLARVNGTATFAWEPDGGIILAQLEWDGPYRIWSDLYRVSPGGDASRLTRGQRLLHPDVHPLGGRAVAVQEGAGTNRLVEVDLSTGELRPLGEFRADEHWAHPRWSPDGRSIAAARWRPGARWDIVVLDPGGALREVTGDRALDGGATWSPDGRWLLWSSDRTGITNLFAAPFDAGTGAAGEPRQVTNVLGGAHLPAVDPAGEWIYYSGYRGSGWTLERIPFDPDRWFPPFETDARFLDGGALASERYEERIEAPSRPYRAFHSLLPRHWEPERREASTTFGAEVVSSRYGVALDGHDLVGRHAWGFSAHYAPRSDLGEGRLDYAFAGLGNPVLSGGVEQRYRSGGAVLAPNEVDTLFLRVRERSARGAVTFLRQRVRSAAALTLGGRHVWQEIGLLERDLEPSGHMLARPSRRAAEGSATVNVSTARLRPLSISAEEGVAGFVRGRVQRDLGLPDEAGGVRGRDRSFGELTAGLRLFRSWAGPGFSNHVVALRGSAGAGAGPGANAFHFDAGGAAGQVESFSGFELFGGEPLLFPVRGYPRFARHGNRAWSATGEYRFPLAILHRGLGLAPLHLDRLSGGLFVDAGNAWGPQDAADDFRSPLLATLWSTGAEVLVSGLPLWTSTVTLRVGVAQPLTGGGGPSVYVRVGRSF